MKKLAIQDSAVTMSHLSQVHFSYLEASFDRGWFF